MTSGNVLTVRQAIEQWLDVAELEDRWEWVETARLDRYVLDRIARRIRSTVAGDTRYLEHGVAAATD